MPVHHRNLLQLVYSYRMLKMLKLWRAGGFQAFPRTSVCFRVISYRAGELFSGRKGRRWVGRTPPRWHRTSAAAHTPAPHSCPADLPGSPRPDSSPANTHAHTREYTAGFAKTQHTDMIMDHQGFVICRAQTKMHQTAKKWFESGGNFLGMMDVTPSVLHPSWQCHFSRRGMDSLENTHQLAKTVCNFNCFKGRHLLMIQLKTYVVRNGHENIKWNRMAIIFQFENNHKEASWIF